MPIANFLIYLDIFGVEFIFLNKGQEKHRTISGALLTIFYCLIVVLLFVQFGVDLYERKNPKVSINVEITPYTPVQLSNKNFTFAYRIENAEGEIFLDETVASPKVYIFFNELINGSWVERFVKNPSNRRCHDFPEYKEKEAYYGISLVSWYCVNFDNYTWGGNWDGNFVNGFMINIEQCINSTLNNNKCATQEKIEKTFIHNRNSGNLFYSQLFLSAQPAMDNYEQPLKTSLVNTYSLLNLKLSKRRVQTFKATGLIQDVGWFWKDLRYQEVLELDTSEPDFSFKDQWEQGVVFGTYNYLGGKKQVYTRTYTKIQEVIANIGGFAKFSYTCITFVFWYIKTTYRELFFMTNFEKYKEPLKNFQLSNEVSKSTVIDKFTYFDYICVKLCKSKSNEKRNKGYKTYMKLESYFNEKMDIVSYLKLYYQVSLLSKAPVVAENIDDSGKNSKMIHSEQNSSHKKITPETEFKLNNYLPQFKKIKK
jgi:hypothetical protein